MLFPFPIILSTYPYVKIVFKEINFFKNNVVYEKYTLGNNSEINDALKQLVKYNKELLLNNQVSINKVRFVFQPVFTYDINNDIINPKYDIMLPINGDNGLFVKNKPIIEINKPENIISVSVNTYKVDDNYDFIKLMQKKSKRGIVILLADEMTILNKKEELYHFSVESEYIRLINLDDAIIQYGNVPIDSELI